MESKDPIHDGSAGGFREPFHDTVCDWLWPKCVALLASQAGMECFDSTAACAALALNKTGVERDFCKYD